MPSMSTKNKFLLLNLITPLVIAIGLSFIWIRVFFPEQMGNINIEIKDNYFVMGKNGFTAIIAMQLFLGIQFALISYRVLKLSSFWTMTIQIPVTLIYLVVVHRLAQDFSITILKDKSLFLESLQILTKLYPSIFLVPLVCTGILFLVVRGKTTISK